MATIWRGVLGLARIVEVDRIATTSPAVPRMNEWHYSPDFNERCPHVDCLSELLRKLREATSAQSNRAHDIEQPASRDLRSNLENQLRVHGFPAIESNSRQYGPIVNRG